MTVFRIIALCGSQRSKPTNTALLSAIAARETERMHIAREIHDDIGGALAAVKLDLAWIGRHLSDPVTLGHVAAATEMHGTGRAQPGDVDGGA